MPSAEYAPSSQRRMKRTKKPMEVEEVYKPHTTQQLNSTTHASIPGEVGEDKRKVYKMI